MRAEGKTITGFGLGWAPSLDGEDFPYQISSREAYDLSKDIPLMIGTTKNEFAGFAAAPLNDSSLEKITATIRQQRGDKTDAFIAAVKKAYPNDSKPSDLIAVDAMFRAGAITQANQKSAVAGGAPVYMYLFTWQSPVMNGKYKAIHCMELPFVFNNIQRCEE